MKKRRLKKGWMGVGGCRSGLVEVGKDRSGR